MSNRLSAIDQLTLWRTREFLREPEAVFWVFAFPILLAFALGLAFKNRGPEKVKIGVLNTAGAPEVRAALDSAGDINAAILDSVEAFNQLRTGRVSVMVIAGDTVALWFDLSRQAGLIG